MESQWYYVEQGQQRGPVSSGQLKELVVSGRLRPTDMVWKEGMVQWVAAESIQGLFSVTRGSPPPPTPVTTPTSLQPTKPLGLVLIAIYAGLSAVLEFLGGAGLMLAGGAAGQAGVAILGLALFLMAVLDLAATYGLWKLLPWGRSLAVFLFVISIPLGVISMLFDTSGANVIMQIIGIGLSVWVLSYLLKPEVKCLFDSQSRT